MILIAACQPELENFQDHGVRIISLQQSATLHVLTKSAGMWLIGRVHDIPKERTWLGFYEWAKESGPIYKHELFGSTHVWISSEKIAKDLLSKQGTIFSDRPLIDNLPINKTGGEYLPLLRGNGTLDSFLLPGTRLNGNLF